MGGRNKKHAEGEAEEEGSDAAEASSTKLPKAKVVRVMRRMLPRDAKIAEASKQLSHDCAVEFVGYVGGEAAERARLEHRRTIVPDNFTWSLEDIGFDSYVEPMQTYMQGHCEHYGRGRTHGSRSSGMPLPRPRHVPPVDTLSPDEPVTVTNEELEFLQSVIPPPPGGY